MSTPTVSIGLPVYNGQNYLAAAVESVLAQTYTDLELIICDNASEDDTALICRSFAERDSRVRYYRNPTNLGAAANHNKCFELASGKYFRWLSHDDVIKPRYIQACVEALTENSQAVLAQCIVHCIRENGEVFEVYDHSVHGTGSRHQHERFRAAVETYRCLEIFGLIRTDILSNSILHRPYAGADQALIIEMALRGPFVLVPECLFLNRDHPGRSSRWKDRMELFTWWTGQRGKWICSSWIFYADCLRLINRYAERPYDRLRCYEHLLSSVRLKGRARLLLFEPFAAINPGIYTFARTAKKALGLGPARRKDRHLGEAPIHTSPKKQADV
jgi:glycosyltransferase involved in cell wall biosynthesis